MSARVSRRQAIAGIGAVTATAAVPAAAVPLVSAVARSHWDAAIARLKTAQAEYERISAHVTAVHDAAEALCPRRDEFFSRYNLGCGLSRERNFRAAHSRIVIERAKGRSLTPEQAKQATADAYRVVDDFENWCTHRNEAFRDYDACEKWLDAAVDERSAAQDALLAADAPDHEALLSKIELLASMLEEADAEDAKRLGAIRKDGRRLLAGTA